MGHIKVHAALDTVGGKLVDPIQGFDTYISYVDDDGNSHPLPCCKVDISIQAGRPVGMLTLTTGTFELDLPGLEAALIRDPEVKPEDTFDGQRARYRVAAAPAVVELQKVEG